jgi:hypothetical protein
MEAESVTTLPAMGITFIYGLHDPRTGALRYVGKSVDPQSRYAGHMTQPHSSVRGWIQSLTAAGLRPEMRILERCTSDGISEEMQWIQKSLADGCELLNSNSEHPGRKPTSRGAYNPHPARQLGRVSNEDWAVLKGACGDNFTQWAVPILLKAAAEQRAGSEINS